MLPPQPNDARLLMPAWWARAFDAASRADGDRLGAMEQAALAGVAPALSPAELAPLALVLATLQRQWLAGSGAPGEILTLASETHLKHANTTVRGRRAQSERIIQQLAGLRIARAGAAAQRFSRLFRNDSWRPSDDGRGHLLELEPERLTAELLFGLADAHAELLRAARGEREASVLLGGAAPLSLWRSIWLELPSIEQAIYLRIECAMQWELRWLSLDGAFGVGVGELLGGLPLAEDELDK